MNPVLITPLNNVDLLTVRLQRTSGRHNLFLDVFLDDHCVRSGILVRLHGLLGLSLHDVFHDEPALPLAGGAHGGGRAGGGDVFGNAAVEASLPGVVRKHAAEGAAVEKVLTDATAKTLGESANTNESATPSLGVLNKNKLKVSWSPSSVVGNKLNTTLMLKLQMSGASVRRRRRRKKEGSCSAAAASSTFGNGTTGGSA